MIRFIGSIIWNTSESLDIPLGRFAPIVFGWMIGAKGKEINKPFKLTFNQDYFERGDRLIYGHGEKKIIITSTPRMHYWQRIKKFFGFNYEWYYKAKEV